MGGIAVRETLYYLGLDACQIAEYAMARNKYTHSKSIFTDKLNTNYFPFFSLQCAKEKSHDIETSHYLSFYIACSTTQFTAVLKHSRSLIKVKVLHSLTKRQQY